MSPALERLMFEIEERWLGIGPWVQRQPESCYGLAIVPRRIYDEHAETFFLLDDVEIRERARPLIPRERVHEGSDVVLVIGRLQ